MSVRVNSLVTRVALTLRQLPGRTPAELADAMGIQEPKRRNNMYDLLAGMVVGGTARREQAKSADTGRVGFRYWAVRR